MPKAKKPKRSTLRNRADRAWEAAIKSAGTCEACGSTETLQAAHVMSRMYYRTRFDLDNGLCLCRRCHKRWTMQQAEWLLFLRDQIGVEKVFELAERAVGPLDAPLDYEAIETKLREILASGTEPVRRSPTVTEPAREA